jgi:antitoxin component YwqK of YwqJK toxin-antitoxin module
MKNIFISVSLFSMIMFSACSHQTNNADNVDTDTLHSVIIPPDTAKKPAANLNSHLNYIDADGKKQGHWKIYGKTQNAKKDGKRYGDLALVEEGDYRDDVKDGEWTTYTPDGKVEKTVFYLKGKVVK